MNQENPTQKLEDREIIEQTIRQVCQKYDYEDDIIIRSILDQVLEEFDSVEDLKGKRILDLGCGHTLDKEIAPIVKILSPMSDERNKYSLQEIQNMYDLLTKKNAYDSLISNDREFEPWLCRVLKELGAEPVGIDIGNLEGEEFEHYQIDLTKKGALDFLPDKSFDFVFSRMFVSSPQLELMANKDEIAILMGELERQAGRLKKDGGKIKIDKDYV